MEPEDAILVLLVLLLGPVVLMVLVSIPIEGIIVINTFLRDRQKSATQILATDAPLKVILEDHALEAKPGLGDEDIVEEEGDSSECDNSRQGVDTIADHATKGNEIESGDKTGPGDKERGDEDLGCGEETDSDERDTSHQNTKEVIEPRTRISRRAAQLKSKAYRRRHREAKRMIELHTRKREAAPDREAFHPDDHGPFHQHQDADVTLDVATLESKAGRGDEKIESNECDTSHQDLIRGIDVSIWKDEAEPVLHERPDSIDRDASYQDVHDVLARHATKGHEIESGDETEPSDQAELGQETEHVDEREPGSEEQDSDDRDTSHQDTDSTFRKATSGIEPSDETKPDEETELESEGHSADGRDNSHQDAGMILGAATSEVKPERGDEQPDSDDRDNCQLDLEGSFEPSITEFEAESVDITNRCYEEDGSNDCNASLQDVDMDVDRHSDELEAEPGDGLVSVWEDYYTFDEEVSTSIDRAGVELETRSDSEVSDSDDRDASHQKTGMSVDYCSREFGAETEDGRSDGENYEASDEEKNGISDGPSPGHTIHTSQDVPELLRDVASSAPSPLPPIVVLREPWASQLSTLECTLRRPRVKFPSELNTSSAPSPLPPIVVSRKPWPSHLSTLEDTLLDSRRPRVKLPSGLNTKPEVPDIQIHAKNTFLGLPAELRLIVYEFALQDHIDSIYSTPPSPMSRPYSEIVKAREEFRPPPFLGGFALNHTSRLVRKESLYLFESLLHEHFHAAIANIHDLGGVRKAASGEGEDDIARIILMAEHDAVSIMCAVHQLGSRTRFCNHEDFLRLQAARLSTSRKGSRRNLL
jgi:hypothetical protein